MQNLGFSLDLKTGSSLLLVPTALTRATQFTKLFKSKLKWLPNIPYINCIFAKARELTSHAVIKIKGQHKRADSTYIYDKVTKTFDELWNIDIY